jgi:hypothetical protein
MTLRSTALILTVCYFFVRGITTSLTFNFFKGFEIVEIKPEIVRIEDDPLFITDA